MAEFTMKALAERMGVADKLYIASAATSTEEIFNGVGNPVYLPARIKLKSHGIDCSGKRAAQVTRKDYEKYDYLICMDDNNLRNLRHIIGQDKDGKVSLLLDYSSRPGASIADPWYTGNFDVTYEDILEGCQGLLEHIIDEKNQVCI
jgi:protein-tyrosine phosphatase